MVSGDGSGSKPIAEGIEHEGSNTRRNRDCSGSRRPCDSTREYTTVTAQVTGAGGIISSADAALTNLSSQGWRLVEVTGMPISGSSLEYVVYTMTRPLT